MEKSESKQSLENRLIEEYINSLSDIERTGLKIAEEQLESSFSIEKSIGFLEFIKNKK